VAKIHDEREIFKFVTGDFECAWDALAGRPDGPARNGGNFMFALLGAILLERICRLCSRDASGKAIDDFLREVRNSDPKYFTKLTGRCDSKRLGLPLIDHGRAFRLLEAIWDLVRNGQAHIHQDVVVKLKDGRKWALMIRGVEHGVPLSQVTTNRSSLRHLAFRVDEDGDLLLFIHPGAFFLDIRDAASRAKLLDRGLSIEPWIKGTGRGTYQLSGDDLKVALNDNRHVDLGARLLPVAGAHGRDEVAGRAPDPGVRSLVSGAVQVLAGAMRRLSSDRLSVRRAKCASWATHCYR
jgi:hypothetical protein